MLDFVHLRDQRFRLRIEDLPCRREEDSPADPLHERFPDPALESFHFETDRRLAEEELLRGTRKALELGGEVESAELLEVHGRSARRRGR